MGDTIEADTFNVSRPEPSLGRVALVWRGDPHAKPPSVSPRLQSIFTALEAVGLTGVPVVYGEEAEAEVLANLLACDGVLAWVDPSSEGQDRSRLDPLLREVASRGVYVSAHPDVILRMGTKEVLYRTRGFSWGADTEIYPSVEDFLRRFPAKLAAAGPRVLKQYRGNGGQGVWKVELLAEPEGAPAPDAPVRVLHARRGSVTEETTLGAFMARAAADYLIGDGRIIDQAFQPRLPEGMIRCYLSQAEVVGYGHQLIKALIPPPPEGPDSEAAQPGPRIMHPPEAPAFQALRRKMEDEWVPQMQALFDLPTEQLPALWDADFLYGPKTADGADTYVLCEINVSAVAPFPETAIPKLAQAALRGVRAAKT